MKAKTSVLIIGLVAIALIATGTVIGVNLSSQLQKKLSTPNIIFLTEADNNTIVSLKTGDTLNLMLPDFGDGGYVWGIVQVDERILSQTNQFTWGSSGLLGDFGKDTWVFTAVQTGSTLLELRCQRPFGEQDVCQSFIVTMIIQ